jgi:transcriptional regulator with XRE-family HTH domain
MSFIGKNIKKIRTVKNLSQAGFAQLFNLARPSVGAYEEGRSEPKLETIGQIARHFGLSIDLLLTKELTVNELYHFDIFKQELAKEPSLIKVAAPAKPATSETRLIKATKTLEYIVQRHEKGYLEQLPTVNFPLNLKHTGRAFEQVGSEMQHRNQGIANGDILLGEFVEPADYANLIPGLVYIVVLQNRIVVRRLLEISGKGKLKLKADNPDYSLLEIPGKEILEIWEVRGLFSTKLKAPGQVEERLSLLEHTVQQLNQRLKNLEN